MINSPYSSTATSGAAWRPSLVVPQTASEDHPQPTSIKRRALTAAALTLCTLGPLAAGVAAQQPALTQSAPAAPADADVDVDASACSPLNTAEVVHCTHPEQTIHTMYHNHDLYFSRFDALTPKQQQLLQKYFHADDPVAASARWEELIAAHPDQASTFLANTHAMNRTYFELPFPRKSVNALDTVGSITDIKGDRLIVQAEPSLTKGYFKLWNHEGGRYWMMREDGKVEKGHIHMDHGDLHGSLHQGYDDQGYTSTKAPRIQWNVVLPKMQPDEVRVAENEIGADIDIDYRSPWVLGFIPNPLHLTYENSVVLDHYDTYTKRWGNPGFTEVPHQTESPARP